MLLHCRDTLALPELYIYESTEPIDAVNILLLARFEPMTMIYTVKPPLFQVPGKTGILSNNL